MRPEGCEADLFRALAWMPFLDRQEMVAVSGWSRAAVYEAVQKLEAGGFCASVLHAVDPFPPARRFHLTAAGLRRLAGEEDTSLDELVRSRPVSAQWRRGLMERLDALAAVYHLACLLSNVAFPIRFRWYRAVRLDAAVALPDGKTVGIVRLLSTTEVPALFALEREAVLAEAGDRIWSPPRVGASVDLRYVLDRTDPGGELPVEDGPQRVSAPDDIPDKGAAWDMADHLLPVFLKPAEKRALDLVSDWPWITLTDLAGLLGVSVPRASQLVNPLEGFRLVARPRHAGPPAGVGAKGRAALHHVGATRTLSALLLVAPARRRPRHAALRPGRLRRRDRPLPLPARGAGGDAGRGGHRAPVGLPQGGHRRPGAAGTRLAHPRRVGVAPDPAAPMNQGKTAEA